MILYICVFFSFWAKKPFGYCHVCLSLLFSSLGCFSFSFRIFTPGAFCLFLLWVFVFLLCFVPVGTASASATRVKTSAFPFFSLLVFHILIRRVRVILFHWERVSLVFFSFSLYFSVSQLPIPAWGESVYTCSLPPLTFLFFVFPCSLKSFVMTTNVLYRFTAAGGCG